MKIPTARHDVSERTKKLKIRRHSQAYAVHTIQDTFISVRHPWIQILKLFELNLKLKQIPYMCTILSLKYITNLTYTYHHDMWFSSQINHNSVYGAFSLPTTRMPTYSFNTNGHKLFVMEYFFEVCNANE